MVEVAEDYAARSQCTTQPIAGQTASGEDPSTDFRRHGPRRLPAQAVEVEVAAQINGRADLRDEGRLRQVIRNGDLPVRTIQALRSRVDKDQRPGVFLRPGAVARPRVKTSLADRPHTRESTAFNQGSRIIS